MSGFVPKKLASDAIGRTMSRLLIVACSQRKKPTRGLLPAIDRYDGPVFLVIRKFLREGAGDAPRILVLSAKYGLIESDRLIPDYDCRLSAASAEGLRTQVLDVTGDVLLSRRWDGVGICAGKDYRAALAGLRDLLPAGVGLTLIEGGQGPRLTALKKWLHQSK